MRRGEILLDDRDREWIAMHDSIERYPEAWVTIRRGAQVRRITSLTAARFRRRQELGGPAQAVQH